MRFSSLLRNFLLLIFVFSMLISDAYAQTGGSLGQMLEQFSTISGAMSGGRTQETASPMDSKKEIRPTALLSTEKPLLLKAVSRLEKDYFSRLQALSLPALKEWEDAQKHQADQPLRDSKDTPLKERVAQKEKKETPNQDFPLTQFGYDFFQAQTSSGKIGGGATADSYLLAEGDELVITFRGENMESYRTRVDSEGRIILPNIEPILAQGLTLGAFRKSLESIIQRTFLNTEAFVSLGEMKNITVTIGGNVENPGTYTLPGLSSLTDLLAQAGGISKSGSLRRIKWIGHGKKKTIDLYPLLDGSGAYTPQTLANGDRIIVPPIGKTVALFGDFKRVGIFELPAKGTLSAKNAISLVGGTLRGTGYRAVKISPDSKGQDSLNETARFDLVGDLYDGDILLALRKQEARRGDIVLAGHVTAPGARSLSAAPTVGTLLKDNGLFKANPYTLFAVLQRQDKATLTQLTLPLDLGAIRRGDTDVSLAEGDQVIVFSMDDIRYLSSADVQSLLKGETPPSIIRLMSDEELQTGQQAPQASDNPLASLMQRQTPLQKKTSAQMKNGSYIRAWQDPSICAGLKSLSAVLLSAGNARFGKAILHAPPQTHSLENVISCPSIFTANPDLLPFLLDHGLSVSGETRQPGIYPIAKNAPLSSVVTVSGGFSSNADLSNIEISRLDLTEDGQARLTLNAQDTSLTTIEVSPGDSVRINPSFNIRESGTVLVKGEVKRPGVYAIKRGEKLSDLLARAGGLTDESYIVGTVFTREDVRATEKRMVERALQDLQSNMMHAMTGLQVKISPEAVLALMHELQFTLSNTESLGRVVVEADPAVLSIRPEMDTILQAGDTVYIPKRPNHVMVAGEVLSPGAMQFHAGSNPRSYVKMAGGTKKTADESRSYLVLPNGTATPVSISLFNFRPVRIPPGSTLMVPRDPVPFNPMVFTKEVLDIVSKAAVTAASIAVLDDD